MRQSLPPDRSPPRYQKVRLTKKAAMAALEPDWRQWPVKRLRAWLRVSPWAYRYCDFARRAEIMGLIEGLR